MTCAHRSLLCCSLLTLLACGGDATNVASTHDAAKDTGVTSPLSSAPLPTAPMPSESPEPTAPRRATSSQDPVAADMQRVCQAVLDAPQLAQYITPSPRRVPLHLIASGPCNGMTLEKHGKPVAFDGGPRDVSITEVALTGSGARARMRYGDQGIVGDFDLERVPDGFRIVKGSVVEH